MVHVAARIAEVGAAETAHRGGDVEVPLDGTVDGVEVELTDVALAA